MKLRASDGCEEKGFPEMLSTVLFYLANPGDKLVLVNKNYKFVVATYRLQVEPRWIYTYDYAPDQSWTVYNGDLRPDSYLRDDYIFNECAYFRICLRKNDNAAFDETDDINEIIRFETTQKATQTDFVNAKPWLADEIAHTTDRVRNVREEDDEVFILMTDSHYTVNGTWGDTRAAFIKLSKELKIDGIIHLGDFTDGMVTAAAMRHYVKVILSDLKTCGVPVYVALGNHDANYFRSNPEQLTVGEQCEIYLEGKDVRYCIDYPNLRLVIIDSFDPALTPRYGYSSECISWLKQIFENIHGDSKALILSHLPPATRLQYWTDTIRGETEIMEILRKNKNKVIAWVNGHNHADRIDKEHGVPIISVANAKCEAFKERKPNEFITPERRLGDASQELFDIVLINARKAKARFIRFGAGRDRLISNGNVSWI